MADEDGPERPWGGKTAQAPQAAATTLALIKKNEKVLEGFENSDIIWLVF